MPKDLPSETERFRDDLRLLTRVQLAEWLTAKVDPSDLVHQPLVDVTGVATTCVSYASNFSV